MTAPWRFLISAGPTREYIDPVRFISNASTGKMGYAVAEAAVKAGHQATLVAGPVLLSSPTRVDVTRVTSALEMKDAIAARFPACDVLVMTAAVSDYRPAKRARQKIHKSARTMTIELERNPDILREIHCLRTHQVIIGFAAETENIVESATRKLETKCMDMILANDVGADDAGFGSDHLRATALFRGGRQVDLGLRSKQYVAEFIVSEAIHCKLRIEN